MDLMNLLNNPAEAGPAEHTDVSTKTPSLDFDSTSPSPDSILKSRQNSESVPGAHQPPSQNANPASSSAMPPLGPPRTTASRNVNRGRQPWSAGGYSLPLLPEGKEEVQVAPLTTRPGLYRNTPSDQSPLEHGYSMSNSSDTFYRHHMNSSSRLSGSLATPREFDFSFNDAASKMRHHMSDSRSSMSSYVSSAFSHSRLSSASTVGHLASLAEDQLHLEKSGYQMQTLPRAPVMDNRPSSRYRTESLPAMPIFSAGGYNYPRGDNRRLSDAQSPSSGMAPEPVRHIPSASSTYPPPPPLEAVPAHRHSQSSRLHEHHGFGHSHKRSTSAPDIPKDLITGGPPPPAPHHRQHAPPPPTMQMPQQQHMNRPGPSAEYSGLQSLEFYPAFAVDSMYDAKARCMYVDDCKTGSTLRKAISHIFGRNKLCTRLVPDSVWVHFCRKHYQRSRYRSAGDYSKLQIVLVQTQIQRVQRWSDDNLNSSRPGELTHWSLCIRKREAKRLEKAAGRKSGASLPSSDDEADESTDGTPKGTEVPQWLISHCGNKYNSVQILDIITRLQNEMENGKISQFPDIEILPSISYDGPAGQKRKPMSSQMGMPPPHRRTQSMSFASGPSTEGMPPPRHVNQEYYYAGREEMPREKRPRLTEMSPGAENRFVPGMRNAGSMGAPELPHHASAVHGNPHGRSQSDISQLHQQMQHNDHRINMPRQRLPSNSHFGSPTSESHRGGYPGSFTPATLPPLVNTGNNSRMQRLPPVNTTDSHSAHLRHASSPLGVVVSHPSAMVAAPKPVRPFAPGAVATLEDDHRPYENEPSHFGRPVQAVPVNAP